MITIGARSIFLDVQSPRSFIPEKVTSDWLLFVHEVHFGVSRIAFLASAQCWIKKLRPVTERRLDSTTIVLFCGMGSHFWQQPRTVWFNFLHSCTKRIICWLMCHPLATGTQIITIKLQEISFGSLKSQNFFITNNSDVNYPQLLVFRVNIHVYN